MKTQKVQQVDQQFRVGSRVVFRFGQERMVGTIVEDRGAIGFEGRRLFRIEAPFGPDEPPLITELGADDLQPA